jgi:hypothetical protein
MSFEIFFGDDLNRASLAYKYIRKDDGGRRAFIEACKVVTAEPEV